MPFSSSNGKRATDRAIRLITKQWGGQHKTPGPRRVLDIGAGSGTYSDRYRANILSGYQWDGVEVWVPYVTQYGLPAKYDRLFIEDARGVVRNLVDAWHNEPGGRPYQFTFLGDVLEHMTKEEAVDLVKRLSSLSEVLVISIPIIHYPQDEWEGNPYEKHVKDDWSVAEVLATWGSNVAEYYVEGEIGVFILVGDIKEIPVVQEILKVTIGVYGIAKNEAALIDRWINQIQRATFDGLIQDTVVLDTGSTDGTYDKLNWSEYIRAFKGAVLPWRFDEAKNAALALLSPDVDLAISIDIDEYTTNEYLERLREYAKIHLRTQGRLPDRVNHSFKTVWDWEALEQSGEADEASKNTSTHFHDRVHSRRGWQWALPVHEILEWKHQDEQPVVVFCNEFWLIQKPLVKEGRKTYLPLLEQSVTERPKVWKSWSFLAQEYLNLGRNEDALTAVNTAQALPDADFGYLEYFKTFIYYNEPDRLRALRRAAEHDNIREYWFYLAERLRAHAKEPGKKALAYEAVTAYQLALSLGMTLGYKQDARVYRDEVVIEAANYITANKVQQ